MKGNATDQHIGLSQDGRHPQIAISVRKNYHILSHLLDVWTVIETLHSLHQPPVISSSSCPGLNLFRSEGPEEYIGPCGGSDSHRRTWFRKVPHDKTLPSFRDFCDRMSSSHKGVRWGDGIKARRATVLAHISKYLQCLWLIPRKIKKYPAKKYLWILATISPHVGHQKIQKRVFTHPFHPNFTQVVVPGFPYFIPIRSPVFADEITILEALMLMVDTLWWTNIAMDRSTIFNGKIHYK